MKNVWLNNYSWGTCIKKDQSAKKAIIFYTMKTTKIVRMRSDTILSTMVNN